MKKKIIGILVCTLLIAAGLLPVAGTTKSIGPAEAKNRFQHNMHNTPNVVGTISETNEVFEDMFDEEKIWYKLMELKFFRCPGLNMTKFNTSYIDDMVEEVNEIYKCQWNMGDLIFVWNRTVIVLDECDTNNTQLLRDVRDRPNCSRGINVIFVPEDYPDGWSGSCTFVPCAGVRSASDGGVKIRNTCNLSAMADTLAHELLHALGLSHQQIKWFGPDGFAPGKPIMPKNTSESPILAGPHGFGLVDVNGDCTVNGDDDSASYADWNLPLIVEDGEVLVPRGEWLYWWWDINRDCEFTDADREYLLFGSDYRTDTVISPAQYEYIWDNADNTSCHKKKRYNDSTSTIRDSPSVAVMDSLSDVLVSYIDIRGTICNMIFDPPVQDMLYLSLDVADNIPYNQDLTYGFFLNTDDNVNTGYQSETFPGADYLAQMDIYASEIPDIEAFLFRYNEDYEEWLFVEELSWRIGEVVEDYISTSSGWEDYRGDAVLLSVPVESLHLVFEGNMKIHPFAYDWGIDDIDITEELTLVIEELFKPCFDTYPLRGSPGEEVTVTGNSFTPNADVSIEFNGILVATTSTDTAGSFIASFTVPSVSGGYYRVRVDDEYSLFDISMFYVIAPENLPPNKPTITGETNGKKGTEYEYTFNAVDPDGDNVKYHIDWDDGDSDTTAFSSSGTDVKVKHTWSTQGTYIIKAKAVDIHGAESDWAELTVTMPRNRATYNSLFLRFLEHFPILQKILGYIL